MEYNQRMFDVHIIGDDERPSLYMPVDNKGKKPTLYVPASIIADEQKLTQLVNKASNDLIKRNRAQEMITDGEAKL